MIGKKDIVILGLKTKLKECKSILETSSYESQKEAAKKQLDSLQEEHKSLTGEYFGEYLTEETMYSEMQNDKIIKSLSDAFIQVLIKGMKIDIKNIESVDAWNNTTTIFMKGGTKHRIDYVLDEVKITKTAE